VRVVARTEGADPERVGALLWVPVVPRRAASGDLLRRVPVTATLRGTAGARAVGASVEVAGAGALDADGEVLAEVLLRGPDTRHTGAFGRPDELRASLATPWGEARVGDHVYGVSPLL